LIDILLYLPYCLAIETQLNALDANSDMVLRQRLTKKLADLLEQPINGLSAWWIKHHAYMTKYDDSSSSFILPTTATVPSPESFTPPIAATSLAYYYSAQAITICLSAITAPSEQLNELLDHHISFVLSAVKYHRACGQYSGGTFMMIYPIKVVLFRSPCPNQREDIKQVLLDWGRERGVEGVCMSGAPMWHRPGLVS
jgi:hypothetical protein